MGQELDRPVELLDVSSGALLPANPENALFVIRTAREMKDRIQGVVRDATAYLVDESRRQGTKTFHTEAGDVSLSGGATTTYDPHDLEEALRAADCPEERIREVVKTKIEYTVDLRILRQLTAANPDYKAAAELAARVEEKAFSAKVTPRI